ncbi:hypothetical protein AS4_07380 [Acinetobacter guillouiae]|nr:hypothetical protein AS4_07380 [Acinetobacter guillouiae]
MPVSRRLLNLNLKFSQVDARRTPLLFDLKSKVKILVGNDPMGVIL